MIMRGSSETAKLHRKIYRWCNEFNPDELSRLGKRIPAKGVYFLYDIHELVYIGLSADIAKRVIQHEKTKVFTDYSFVEIGDINEAMLIERTLIDKFKPKYNKDGLAKINRIKK